MEMADALLAVPPLGPPIIGFLEAAGAGAMVEESGRFEENAPKLNGSLVEEDAAAGAGATVLVPSTEDSLKAPNTKGSPDDAGVAVVAVEVGAKASKLAAAAAGAGAALLKAPKSALNISLVGVDAAAGEGEEKSSKSATGAGAGGATAAG